MASKLTTINGVLPLLVIPNLDHLIIRKSKMEWISVKDRMPDNNQQVKTKDNINREFDCTFYHHENRGNRPYFHVNGYVWEHDNVTHWMPSTVPPKE